MVQGSVPPATATSRRVTFESVMAAIDTDAQLDTEERLLLDQVRRLVEMKIAPRAAAFDQTGRFPDENVADINSLGLNAMFIPADCGGAALSYASYLAVLREISSGCASTGLTWATNFHATNPLADAATLDQRQRLLPIVAEGGLAAVAITERSGGSDATAMSTRFVPDGDDVVLNGEKIYITNGDVADLILVFGKWAPLGDSKEAISAVVVRGGTPGLEIRRREDKLGHRASSTVTLGFSDVRASRADLIGKPGAGLSILQTGLNKSRPSVAAHLLGIAQAALQDLLAYGRERIIRGQPILNHQSARFKLAEIACEFIHCNALLWHVARLADTTSPEFTTLSGMLKLKASQVAVTATDAALQMHGGAGYCREYRVERLMRDARLGPVGEGASEMLLDLIGRNLAGIAPRSGDSQ